MAGAIVLQIVLICLNAVFAAAEIAVVSTNRAKLEKMAEDGNRKAKKLFSLTKNTSKFLSTIQVAITLAGLLGSAYAADNFAEPIVGWLTGLGVTIPADTLHAICVFLITLILSYFSIVFGELIPKRLAMKNPEKMALSMAGILQFVSAFFAPFVWVLTQSTNGLLRLLHINPDEQEESVTEEEIRMMLDTGSEKGTIDKIENEMIQNVFEFDDISISEIGTHRRDVAVLYREDSIEEWRKTIDEKRHNYYPICGEDADDVIGVLNTKNFFRAEASTPEQAIREATEKPYFVPENMKAAVLLQNMKETRNYFAVVIDEYGGMSGIVTIHDLLELLVGVLADKEEPYIENIQPLGENEWRIAGDASLEEVGEALGLTFDTEECDTFGGYILGLLGEVPDDGSVFDMEAGALQIHVNGVDDHRIESAVVRKKEQVPEQVQEQT